MELDHLRFGIFFKFYAEHRSPVFPTSVRWHGFLLATVLFGVLEIVFFFFDHEASLCESIRSILSWLVRFVSRCLHQFHIRWTRLSRNVTRVSSGKLSMYFREAKSIHKWLADAISLQIMLTDFSLALKWMFVLPPGVLLADLLEFRTWIKFNDLQRFAVPTSLRVLVEFPSIFLNVDRRRANILPHRISNDFDVVEVWFVASIRFFRNRQPVSSCPWTWCGRCTSQVYIFSRWIRSSWKRVVLPLPATASRSPMAWRRSRIRGTWTRFLSR